MGIATWMMGKMMDKFLALPAAEKAQVIGMMAEKFQAAATPEETARVAEILMPRFLDAFLRGASDQKKQEMLRAVASPEMVQRMVGEMAPAAVGAAMSSALPEATASAVASSLPGLLASRLPEAMQGALPAMMESWLRGLSDEKKKELFGSLLASMAPSMPKPPRPSSGGTSSGGMMGGMMGGGPWG